MGNTWLTEYRAEIGIILTLAFATSTVIGTVGVFIGPEASGFWSAFDGILNSIGTWVYWLLAIGAIGIIVCGWWLGDYFIKVKKLRILIDTTSKAKFLKNLDDIEYLAWRLPKKYRVNLSKKKQELKIRQ